MSLLRLSAFFVLLAVPVSSALAQDAFPLEMLRSAWFDGIRKADRLQAAAQPAVSQRAPRSVKTSQDCRRDWHVGLAPHASNGSRDREAARRWDKPR
ncbi:hypothetical protein [Aurantimonas sp. VKM B-3413]|uniref:hypothetical protein n=1 Tax=Aurantimonas sp. VKM B-3413 TaxID=2779401 RepID=UPI001E628E53|nr:hypothetical protein [Aurantimonas sp. VKM B-3413]MCB8840189.1 hypothetical protein [Aurantimonas sp. VKM B-3413]